MSEHDLNDDELDDAQGEALPDRELMTLLPVNPLGGEFVQLDPPVEQAGGPGEDV
jgi:hypothetical protein